MEASSHTKSARVPTILLAMEPRAYREVIGATIRELRPNLRVVTTAPSTLLRELDRLEPVLVIADQPDTDSRAKQPCWVYFSPYASPAATARLGDERREIEEMGLDDLLGVIDQAVYQSCGGSRVYGTG